MKNHLSKLIVAILAFVLFGADLSLRSRLPAKRLLPHFNYTSLFHMEYLSDMFLTPLTVQVSSEKRAVLEATMVSVDEMTRCMKLDFETLESSTARGTGATAARGDPSRATRRAPWKRSECI